MGTFLSFLSKQIQSQPLQNIHTPIRSQLQQLRHQYSSFSSICQDYGIDSFAYSEIFDGDFDSFKVWDTNNKGKIDAFQLFSGLILFSDGKFSQKIEFLFEIFDLNEELVLNYESVQFLIYNCCVATMRIFRVSTEINEEQIEEFLNQYFCLNSKITRNQLYLWASKSEQVLQFFRLINQQTPTKPQSYPLLKLSSHYKSPRKRCIFKPPFFDLYRKQLIQDYSLISPIYQYLQQPDFSTPITQMHPTIQWIFGLRYNDIRQPIHCITTTDSQAANEKLFYFIGCIVVIYYPKLQIQEYYYNHKKEVSCFKVSKGKNVVATGEHGNEPKIHIWDMKTKETVKIFAQIHRNTIIALEFVSNDQYLVSISESQSQNKYPFVIQNIKTGQILFSGQLQGYFLSMMQNKCDPSQSSFTLVCDKSYSNYHFTDQAFLKTNKVIPDPHDEYLDAVYSYDKEQCCMLVISSAKEKIYFICEKETKVIKMNEKILSMKIVDRILYAMSERDVYEIELKTHNIKCLKVGIQLGNDTLLQLISTNNSLYLLTNLGLVYNYHLETKKIKKVPQLFGVENPKSISMLPLLNELYFTSGPLLWIIDTKTKELKNLKCSQFGDISSIYVDDNNLLMGTEQGTLIVYKNTKNTDIETIQPITKQFQKMIIKDIALANKNSNSSPSILLLVERSIIVLNYTQLSLTKQYKLQNIQLNKIAKSPIENLMLGMSSEKEMKVYKFQYESFKEIDISKKSQFIQTVIDNKAILFHPQKNLLLVSGKKGKIHFWNDYNRAQEGKDLIEQLGGHSSEIFELLEYSNYQGFISIGATDRMIIQWQRLMKHKRDVKIIKNFTEDSILKNQFNIGIQLEENPQQLRDSLAVIKPITDKCHNEIIQQILLPDNEKYESLIDVKKSKQQMRLAPLVTIKLTKVLGFECHNVRKSLLYCHYYKSSHSTFEPFISGSSKQPIKLKVIPSALQNELLYSKQNLIPYIQSHTNCNKKLVYFSDRIGIIHDIITNQQKFYQHHKNKITAMCIHPSKQLICTVESPSITNDTICTVINRSKIHIWNSHTLKRQTIIQHYNNGTVHRIEFSRNGKYLCTLTKLHKQDCSSIQVYDWENNLYIAQRVFPNQILLDFEFNPYKPMQITVVGIGIIAILQIVNTLLIVKQKHNHSDTQIISCLSYVYNCYGDIIQSDILTGNSQGDISLLICGKYIKVKEKAHQGIINCLKVGELFQYMIVLMTAGEDKYLKIWSTKMELMLAISIKNLSCFGGDFSQFSEFCNYSPQSLDIYHCFQNSKQPNKAVTNVLIGTRGGDIVELTIKYQESSLKYGMKSKQQNKQEKSYEKVLEGTITYDSKAYLRNTSSENMLGFAIYKDIMLTFNEKQCIYVWDIVKYDLISIKKIRGIPSVVKFSNSGEIFVIGYTSGEIELFEANFNRQLIPIQTIQNIGSSVINVCFSISDKKIVVSLISQKYVRQTGHQDFISQVHAYIRGSGKDSFLSRKDFNKFTSKVELSNKSMSKNMGVCFMDFSTNQKIVLLRYQPMRNNKRIFHQKQNKFIMWNIQTNQVLHNNESNIEFSHLNFSNTVNTSYIYRNWIENKYKQQNLQAEVSQMSQYQKFICLGMSNGEIILTQSSAFYNQKAHASFGKIYKAHSSCIEYMKVEDNYLYTSGFKNKSIMIWKLEEQNEKWDYDSGNMVMEDPYSEKYTKERLNKYVNDIFPKRRNIFEIYGNIKQEQKLGVKINLNKVLGRNAFYKRNNLFYDYNDSIITHSGCNILIMSKQGNQPLEQKVAQLDKNFIFFLPQISAITISQDRKLLAIGTFSEQAKLFLWDINSQTIIFQLTLKQIIQIHHLALSYNCKYIVCTGLSNHNDLVLFLVDVERATILACHDLTYTVNTKIHDIIFIPGEQSMFLTCGLHNLTQWNYSCGLFNSQLYQVQTQQNAKNHAQEPINFYSMVFVKNILITAASDGYIYIWKNKKLWKKQSAHPNYSILILHTTPNSEIFASGGTDGKVIFWQLSGDVIQKLSQFEVFEFNRQNPITIKHHIQSICIGKQKMVVGTRCGDIYQFDKPKEIANKLDTKNRRLILPAFNHEKIMSVCFSSSSRWFYILTEKGCLEVHEIETLNKIYSKQLLLHPEHHKQKTVLKMFVCVESDLIYIIYKQQIQLYQFKKQKLKSFYPGKQRSQDVIFKLSSFPIKQVVLSMLSPNQKHLACLINADKNLKIVIFTFPKTSKPTDHDWFKNSYTIQIYSQLHFFDFSNDSNYFLRVHTDNSFVLDLKDNKQVATPNRQQTIQWVGQGKLKLQAFKDIASVFRNSKHKLLEAVQITNKCVVVTDEIGSLLVFGYPARGYASAHFYHLNNVYICQVSPDNRTLITVGEYDKSIHIWDIEEEEELGRKRTYPSIFDSE